MRAVARDPRITRQSFYEMTFFFDPNEAEGLHRDQYLEAVSAEGCPLGKTYAPVYDSPLMNLQDRTSPIPFRDPASHQDYEKLNLPNVTSAVGETAVLLSHSHLLGERDYLDQLLDAIGKINDNLIPVRQKLEATP